MFLYLQVQEGERTEQPSGEGIEEEVEECFTRLYIRSARLIALYTYPDRSDDALNASETLE